MRKKTLNLFTLAMIAILAGACSCGKKPAGQGEGGQGQATGSAASSMTLKVTAPDGWTPNATNPNVVMKGTGSYSIKIETMPSDASTPDSFIEFVKKTFDKTFKNCRFDKTASLKVSGFEARRLDFSADVAGMKMYYITLYVFTGGKAHTLTCGALGGEFAKLKGDFEKIVASARME